MQHGQVPGFIHEVIEDIRGFAARGGILTRRFEDASQIGDGAAGPSRQPRNFAALRAGGSHIGHRGTEGNIPALGVGGQVALRGIPHPAFWFINDAAQRDGIIRIGHRVQVREGILDFFALIEAGAADDPVGNPGAHEHFFQGPRLGIGAVKHRHIAVTHPATIPEPVNFRDDEMGFVAFRISHVAGDLFPAPRIRPQLFRPAPFIMGNDGIGGRENILGGAIVLLEDHAGGIREVLLKILNIADGGPAEGVNGLIGIAHHGERGAFRALPGQGAYQDVLGVVGVLIFVHQNVAEAGAVALSYIRVGGEHLHRAHNKIIEIQRIGALEAILVGGIGLGQHLAVPIGCGRGLRGWGDQFILEIGDLAAEHFGRVGPNIDVFFPAHHGHEALGIRGIVNGEGGTHPERAVFGPQNPHAGRMEGGDPHAAGQAAEHPFQAFAHFPRRLIGESDGEDIGRVSLPGGDEVGDARGEHPGFTRAGPGDHEQRATAVNHGFPLGAIEAGENTRRRARDLRRARNLRHARSRRPALTCRHTFSGLSRRGHTRAPPHGSPGLLGGRHAFPQPRDCCFVRFLHSPSRVRHHPDTKNAPELRVALTPGTGRRHAAPTCPAGPAPAKLRRRTT